MSQIVTFEQVYWYLHACPLRRRRDKVLHVPAFSFVYNAVVTPGILDLYGGKSVEDVLKDTLKRLEDVALAQNDRSVVAHAVTASLAYSALLITQLHDSEILARDLDIVHKGLSGHIDLIRLKKPANLIQAVWVLYESEYPDADYRIKLYQAAQWNARVYELNAGKRPFQLTYFMPLINETLTFPYNPDSKLDVVAELVLMGAFPARPGPECDACNACSMKYNKPPTHKGEYSANRHSW